MSGLGGTCREWTRAGVSRQGACWQSVSYLAGAFMAGCQPPGRHCHANPPATLHLAVPTHPPPRHAATPPPRHARPTRHHPDPFFPAVPTTPAPSRSSCPAPPAPVVPAFPTTPHLLSPPTRHRPAPTRSSCPQLGLCVLSATAVRLCDGRPSRRSRSVLAATNVLGGDSPPPSLHASSSSSNGGGSHSVQRPLPNLPDTSTARSQVQCCTSCFEHQHSFTHPLATVSWTTTPH